MMIPKQISCVFRRLTRLWSSAPARKKKSDPTAALEMLEWWSWRATIIILLASVSKLGRPYISELQEKLASRRVSKLTADLLIGIGLAIEAICILRAIVENRKEKRKSDEKIADANERASAEQKAAEARERTADIERLTAWRHVLPEWKRDLSDAMQDMAPSLDVLIEFEAGMPKTLDSRAKSLSFFKLRHKKFVAVQTHTQICQFSDFLLLSHLRSTLPLL